MQIEIHAIDRDNGTGAYVRRHVFRPETTGTVNHEHPELPGLITHQDVYSGLVATIEAPDGCTFGTTASGETVLIYPEGGLPFSADHVLSAARAHYRPHRLGFSIVAPAGA